MKSLFLSILICMSVLVQTQVLSKNKTLDETISPIAYVAELPHCNIYMTEEGHLFYLWNQKTPWTFGDRAHLFASNYGGNDAINLETGESTFDFNSEGTTISCTYEGRSVYGPLTIKSIKHLPKKACLSFTLSNGVKLISSYKELDSFDQTALLKWQKGDIVHIILINNEWNNHFISKKQIQKISLLSPPKPNLLQNYGMLNLSQRKLPYLDELLLSSEIR